MMLTRPLQNMHGQVCETNLVLPGAVPGPRVRIFLRALLKPLIHSESRVRRRCGTMVRQPWTQDPTLSAGAYLETLIRYPTSGGLNVPQINGPDQGGPITALIKGTSKEAFY